MKKENATLTEVKEAVPSYAEILALSKEVAMFTTRAQKKCQQKNAGTEAKESLRETLLICTQVHEAVDTLPINTTKVHELLVEARRLAKQSLLLAKANMHLHHLETANSLKKTMSKHASYYEKQIS